MPGTQQSGRLLPGRHQRRLHGSAEQQGGRSPGWRDGERFAGSWRLGGGKTRWKLREERDVSEHGEGN